MKKIVALLLALVMVLSMMSVAAFAEEGDTTTEEDGETVDVGDVDAEETESTDSNPTTGIALAALPMVVAAAGVVASKKH